MKQQGLSKTIRRHDRLIRERVHDAYKLASKLPEPTVCPQCGAVYHKGHWTWAEHPPEGAASELCQACHRINDGYPAGELTVSGDFAMANAEEILNLARNVEELEKTEHPLHRIMAIEEHPDHVLITTTDIHLPRRIGEALSSAWKGDLDMHYDEEGYFIRIGWKRAD